MINNFKQFENNSDTPYVVIDMERGVIESVTVFNDKESAYNWVRNFVYENYDAHGLLEVLGNETDPYELLLEFNDKWGPEIEMYLEEAELSPPVKLDKSIELRMTTNKYNI